MAPQTRSRGKAPAARVYHSSPAPTQAQFPSRRRVVRTYGKGPQSTRSLRQQTLTQIGYVDPVEPEDLDMTSTLDEPPKKKRKRDEGAKNRRKTMGDAPNSSFHTQTLTQFLSDKSADNEGMLSLRDSDEEQELSEGEKETTLEKKQLGATNKALSHVTDSRAASLIPQTPVHKKTKRDMWEVPSSQPTPTTPLDIERHRIPPLRSPLQEKTTNIDAGLPTSESISKRPRNLEIQDSYCTGTLSSDNPETPSKPTLPTSIHVSSQPRASVELGESMPEATRGEGRGPTHTKRALPDIEIPDSDAELESLGPSPWKSTPGLHRFSTPKKASGILNMAPSQTTPKISTDGEIASSDQDLDPGSPTPVARKARNELPQSSRKAISKDRSAAAATATAAMSSPKITTAVTPTPLSRNAQSETAQNSSHAEVLADTPSKFQVLAPQSQRSTRPSQAPTQKVVKPGPPAMGILRGLASRSQGTGPQSSWTEEPLWGAPLMSQKPAPRSQRSTVASQPSTQKSQKPGPGASAHPNQGAVPQSLSGEEVLTETPLVSQKSASSSQRSTRASQPSTQKIQRPGPGAMAILRGLANRAQEDDDSLSGGSGEGLEDEGSASDAPNPKSQFYTQGLESQRVPLEIIRSMAPHTDRSDIILSIHPEPAEAIAQGAKDHEFRSYKIPGTVSRIWIYVTRPICELRYMAIIGPAKQPGQINGESGEGNREFNEQNANSKYKFAYELLQVYQLNNPVPLEVMKENGWVDAPPQKYIYVPPAVVGQLLGNLRCALFDEEQQSNLDVSQHISSTPQEIEDQLRSDILHSTQLQAAEEPQNEIVPSSQDEHMAETPGANPKHGDVFARPQLPASRTKALAPKMPTTSSIPAKREYNNARPSQATTASQPSSPVISPEKSVPRPPLLTSGLSFPEYVEDDSPLRLATGQQYSLGSSQALLQDSLMVDDVRPPPVIWDSEDEELED